MTLSVMKSASIMCIVEDILRRTSAAKMYKRGVLSYSNSLREDKYLKYKQGDQDIKRDRPKVYTKGKSRFNHDFG